MGRDKHDLMFCEGPQPAEWWAVSRPPDAAAVVDRFAGSPDFNTTTLLPG